MQSRAIQLQIDLEVPREEVWKAWTNEEGVLSFFSPACNIELRPGGTYEIFFDLDAPAGQRGADDMIVLAFQEPLMFSFTWNAPGNLAEVRPHRSHVTLRMEKLSEGRTRLHFREDGFGEGGQWDERFDYLVNAWGKIILPRLAFRFANGPVDWTQKVDLEALQHLVKTI